MHSLAEAGVGIVYLPGLEKLVESHLHLLNAIEIEPQTLWYNKSSNCDSFTFDVQQTRRLQEYPVSKLFHSVGFPVGGTLFPGAADLELLNDHAALISPLWISEHLSFNSFETNGQLINTNFLLPPLQTKEGIDVAVRNINYFRSGINLPFAFETGVNYLAGRKGEIPDGVFVAEIANRSDSHILLDLHNIMANQINGRQPVDEFVSQLPLDRVCEIHIAGGFFYNNYYLDGHSGVSGNELFDMLNSIIRKLPDVKALIFEMLPEYEKEVSVDAMRIQLEQMHRAWDNRGKDCTTKKRPQAATLDDDTVPQCTVKEWENSLGLAALGWPANGNRLYPKLCDDPGIDMIRELIFQFRASTLVTALRFTTRLLRLSLGRDLFNEELKTFLLKTAPEIFAFASAKKFSRFLQEEHYSILYLDKILEFELASLNTMIDSKPRSVEFDFNPLPVLRSLSDNELPEKQDRQMTFVLDIQPDEQAQNLEAFNFYSVYHN